MFTTLGMILAENGNDNTGWDAVLSIAAIILFVYGVVQMFKGQILFGILWIIAAALVGPGGISLLT